MSVAVTAKASMSWTNWRGKEETREINELINVQDFIGTPGYSMLIVAANTHLPVSEIEMFLELQSEETPGVARSRSWIQRRRWLFQQPDTDNFKGTRADADGRGIQARKIMAENPALSVRQLEGLLKRHFIKRSREWVRKHRCDGLTTSLPIQ